MENTECFGTEPMPYEKAVKSAKAFGKEMPFVVYRGGVPVAFAMSSKSAGGYSTVSEVYSARAPQAGLCLGACRP